MFKQLKDIKLHQRYRKAILEQWNVREKEREREQNI